MHNLNAELVTETQYELVAARRQSYDAMLWQTPVISLTAQAFLFTIALGTGNRAGRIVASVLAMIAALASAQLLAKHRHFEVYYAKLLEQIELKRGLQPIHAKPPSPKGPKGWSSYLVWQIVFWAFALAAALAGLLTVCDA